MFDQNKSYSNYQECRQIYGSVIQFDIFCKLKELNITSLSDDVLLHTYEENRLSVCKLFSEYWIDSYRPFENNLEEICFDAITINFKDPQMCKNSSRPDVCISMLALVTDEIGINECKSIGNNGCIMNVAIRTSDSSICDENFSDRNNYKNCIKGTKDPNWAEKMIERGWNP